jgi:uncharacterized protein (UPF0261 family)
MPEPSILLIGTLDTKGVEIGYCRDRLRSLGARPVVLDSGILGEALAITADFSREDVARAAGHTIDKLRHIGSRGAAVERMKEGVKRITLDLLQQDRLDGVLCLGGAEGAIMGSTAMRALPLGVPKLIVTPIASGRRHFGMLMGDLDITVMHSVVDILGLNPISTVVYDNACGAVLGMAQFGSRFKPAAPGSRFVGVTMLGQSTPGVMALRDRLAQHGYECVIFHANGIGGPAMEQFAEMGTFIGVVDYTTNELSHLQVGGFHMPPPNRLERVGAIGLPQVVVPGNVDLTTHGVPSAVPEALRSRPLYYHNPEMTLVRTLKDEMAAIGAMMARKLNQAKGPVVVMVPTGGLSQPNRPGGVFWDPEADAALLAALKADLRPSIPLIAVDAHLNDASFAERVADEFLKLMSV